LNTHKTKTAGTKVTISSDKAANIIPFVAYGSIAVIFGVTVYYAMPLSLLSQNFSLFLSILFFILIALILGLSILAFNLQGLVEWLIKTIMLFYETSSMR
jgi:hypothetical protein